MSEQRASAGKYPNDGSEFAEVTRAVKISLVGNFYMSRFLDLLSGTKLDAEIVRSSDVRVQVPRSAPHPPPPSQTEFIWSLYTSCKKEVDDCWLLSFGPSSGCGGVIRDEAQI